MLNKRNFLLFILLSVIVLSFQNCSNNQNPLSSSIPTNDHDLHGTVNGSFGSRSGEITPIISGTFIDFWGKGNWSASKWDTHIKEMKAAGIKTLIVQFASYNTTCWFYSTKYASSSENYIHALPRLLYAASVNGLDVYVGLYFNEAYWNNTANSSWLNAQAQKNKIMAQEIWNQFGGYMGFKGWYISYEPAPYYYKSKYKVNLLKNKLINPIADYCKSISDKPVAMTAFFNDDLSTTSSVMRFMERLSSAHLDIIMLQDGIGVGHASMNDLESYYNEAEWGLFGEGHFSGAFWADVETFDIDGTPASIDRVGEQLDMASYYCDKIVSFQYYEDMCPSGPNGYQANTLRNDYLDYSSEF